MSLNLPLPGLSGRAPASGDKSSRTAVADVTPVADAAASSGEATTEVKSTFDRLMAQHKARTQDGATLAAHARASHPRPEHVAARSAEKVAEKAPDKPTTDKADDKPVHEVAARSQKPVEQKSAPERPKAEKANKADETDPGAATETDTAPDLQTADAQTTDSQTTDSQTTDSQAADPQTAGLQADAVVTAEAASVALPVAADAQSDGEAPEALTGALAGALADALPITARSGGASPRLPPAADDEAASGTTPAATDGKGDFAALFDKGVKGRGAAPAISSQKSADPNPSDGSDDGKDSSAAFNRPAEAEVKAVLARVQTGLDAFQQTRNAPAQDTKQADPAALPVAQSDTTTPASGFSLQTLTDTQGSYSASGASAASASNLSKAAVETLSALSVQISKHLSEGNTRFALELHPADLGKVEVSLNIGRDGKTTAHLRFDNPMTASTFSAHEADLRQQLAQTGLTLDKDSLSFSSRDADDVSSFGSSFAQEQQREQQQQNQSQQARLAARALQAADQSASEVDANTALDTALARFRNRSPSQTIALNLIV